jgi:hypothetical protein
MRARIDRYYPPDREAGDAMVEVWPAIVPHMLENRKFMHRVTRFLAQEAGIRQFLDIGTGIPTRPNVHEVAQSIAPESRVVYVDNDPIVLTLSEGLSSSTPEGRTEYIEADMLESAGILDSPQFREAIDLGKPVGLTFIAIVHLVMDEDDPVGIVRRLLEPLPSGSYLAMSIGTADFAPEEVGRVGREYAARGMPMRLRTLTESQDYFESLELVDPGITQVHRWRPDDAVDPEVRDEQIAMYGAVARKP